MQERNIELLKELKDQIEKLPERDYNKLDQVRRRAHLLIEKIFGSESKYKTSINSIYFKPSGSIGIFGGGPNIESYIRSWKIGKETFINIINTILEDISLSIEMNEKKNANFKAEKLINFSDEIFVVHGHNEVMKQSVARVIEKLNLKPLILHEMPNKGRTIIQKFIDHSDVGFAIILMSADDYGFSKDKTSETARLRARQNVILELGFFLGKLGTNRVIALFEQIENFEIPSDYDGVIFIQFDTLGKWKFDIIRELKALNYQVDANKLV